ncbi:Fimbrial adapter papK precursor [Serratia quinivorans]|jgi:type 1 fimbria pilin|uniref:fimbrial protein n=1 Tax=Serratia quinivorans TaxID=137545 RepID=UPI00217C1DE6|nr:fimbrial protein [Serratia quinivorans]CAI0789056.1 Fimbrial adapter papK precursor [Serratia quinivorans]CAI0984743.1 Fimbrial adapter papK precursor [Serratia quinivorans]CAI1731976.1 Fimbrial adapter papK precursor [Serratia quinivorans]CAI1818501.1 Fimbrial adapter papK precursor [Serratia quinivorans]CAI2056826.1 Fimbrial adapter papK precursor [Serratia quinivorans]
MSKQRKLLAGLLACGLASGAQAATDMKFHGELVAEPCVVAAGDDQVALDFGELSNKDLYSSGRTKGKAFQLRLTGCDPAIAKDVRVTFSGTESSKLPGLLALDGASQAGGVAIGLETPTGVALALDKPSEKYPLKTGSTVIDLQAYVRAEPQAVTDKSLTLGSFSTAATFTLDYP